MDQEKFHLSDHEIGSRLAKLSASQVMALEKALDKLLEHEIPQNAANLGKRDWPIFLLPFAEFGLSDLQMLRLAAKLPVDYPLDHREIYFDFRLDRWIKHIEPPTLAGCLDEYLTSSETHAQGMAYLEKEWRAFLHRHDQR